MAMLENLSHLVSPLPLDLKNMLVTLLLVFISIFFYLRQLLLPVDKRRPPAGKKWKLPPGPRGYPILGNLFLFAKGEMGVRTKYSRNPERPLT